MGVFDVTPGTRSPVGFDRQEPRIVIANCDPPWLEGSPQVRIKAAAD